MRHTTASFLFIFWAAPASALTLSAEARSYTNLIVSHNEEDRCRTGADPFAIPAFIFAGPARRGPDRLQPDTSHPLDLGGCIDQSRYRAVLPVTERGKAAYGMTGTVFANVRHEDRYYLASIPVESVRGLVFQIPVFSIPALGPRRSHVQILASFAEPVVLAPQFPANPAQRLTTRELVFSADSVGVTNGARFHPTRNFDGSLLLVNTVATREARLFDLFVEARADTVEQYRLRVTPAESAAYVRTFLRNAEVRRATRQYALDHRNCTTSQFEVLDRVLDYPSEVRERMGRGTPFDPQTAPDALRKRNLVEAELPAFETEAASRRYLTGRQGM